MANPFLNKTLYVDPSNSAKTHADSIRASDPTRAEMFDKIGNNPIAMWAGNWIAAGTEASWVDQRMDAADAQGAYPVFVIYNVPVLDAGGFSAGGAANWTEYHDWLARVISGFAGRTAAIIYEPDALGHMPELSATDRSERAAGMAKGIQDLVNAGLSVYVDAGNSAWHPVATTASLLQEITAGPAQGIALNVSNFRLTSELETYGADVITASGFAHTMVLDTSRNGLGPEPNGDVFNPPGRALGNKPSVNSTNAYVDAYIWVKGPGESDGDDGTYQTADGEVGDSTNGTIAPAAGGFWPNYAYGLAKRATWSETTTLAKADTVTVSDWSTQTSFNIATGARVVGTTLEIDASTGYPSASSIVNYDFRDSHWGANLISPPSLPADSGQSTVIVGASEGSIYIGYSGSGNMYAGYSVGTTYNDSGWVPYDATAHKYIRVREAAGNIYWEVSPDYTTWTSFIPSIATPFAVDNVALRINAGNWGESTTFDTATYGPANMAVPTVTEPTADETVTGTLVSSTTSPAIITGLKPATNYQMRVRGKNSVGVSTFSPWVSFKTDSTIVSVDFATPRANSLLSDLSFGSCISTYSGDGQNVNIIKGTTTESTAWKNKLGELGPVAWRIPLAWNGGTPGSSAGGARTQGDADEYINAIKSIGGIPIIAVGGTTGDNDILAADAANLVHFFNDNGGQNGGPVTNWIIGNEPDNDGTGITGYINGTTNAEGVVTGDGFNAVVTAMRAATTLPLTIAGPALVTYADYKEGDYNAFFDACGDNVDVVDFHMYDGATLAKYTTAINWFNQQIASRANMAGRVKVQLGEYNWSPAYTEPTNGVNQFLTTRNTIAGAITNGRLVESGGRAYQYSDNNGPLGMITPGNGLNGTPDGYRLPTPAFYGVKMWSGGNLFRRPTGNMATCSSVNTSLEVFASTENKNVVITNKSETASFNVQVALTGTTATGTYEIWQTIPGFDPNDVTGGQWKDPIKVASGSYSNSQITFSAPAATVSTILVGV